MSRLRKLSPRVQLAAAIAAPLLVLAAGWLLLVGPERSTAAASARQVAAKQDALALARAQAARVPPSARIEVADLYRLVTAMPDQEDMPGIILQLDRTAAAAGIAFNSITPGSLTTGSGYQVQKIQLDFSGDYYSLSDFLQRLRSLVAVHGGRLAASGRLFSVEQLSLTEGKPSFPKIDAQLTLDAYVYGAGATPPAATAAATPTTTAATTTSTATTTTTPAPPPAASPTAAPASPGVTG